MITRKIYLILISCVLVSGCATRAGSGALIGTGLGAAGGALVGSQKGNAGVGALVGGGLGALTGAVIGDGLDDVERRNEARIAAATAPPPVPAPPPMTIGDVIQMRDSGVSDDLIIAQIYQTNSHFTLSAADITALSQRGVSNRVIQAMMDTGRARPVVAHPRPVVVHPRPVVVEPVYVIERCPPPPCIGFGFGFHHHHHRRHCW
jgi:surface antigen